MSGPVVLVVLVAGFLLGVVVRSQWKGRKVRFYPVPVVTLRLGSRAPAASSSPVPSQRVLGMEPTAVYVPRDRAGAVVYAGITNNLEARFRQHADSKAWAREVASVSAHWFPDRYQALAAEWALIHYLDPPHNTAPSGTCDAWTEPRPPVRTALVRWPKSRARVRGLVGETRGGFTRSAPNAGLTGCDM